MEFRVNIYIETSRRGPSKGPGEYMYIIEFFSQKTGEPITRQGMESFECTFENELALKAMIAAAKRLTKPCNIRFYTTCNHVLSTVHNSWHIQWQKNGWKRSDGKPAKNAALWEELVAVLKDHVVTYTKDEHSYRTWMREQLERN